MPPVRWKRLVYVVACLTHVIICADAQLMQDAISMTSDGWRPIVGTRKDANIHDEILHYRNQEGESIKAETRPAPTSTKKPPTTKSVGPLPPPKATSRMPPKQVNKPQGKIPVHSKHNPYFALPAHGAHGPHIPIGAVTLGRPSQAGQIKKYPTSAKPFVQMSLNGKRHLKPIRVQTNQHNGNREEIFSAAHSTGAYAFYKPQNNVKTRQTGDLGIQGIPASHYTVNQPHTHIEFSNRFAVPPIRQNENLYQQYNPLQSFVSFKPQQTNDIPYQFQNPNDDFTRNLVPPPPIFQKIKKDPIKIAPNKDLQPQPIPEKIIAQVPPPLEFAPQKITQSENPVQVQVTREKLNAFHNNIPQNYNGDYLDYDYHTIKKPIVTNQQKPLTYEVTEGKYWGESPTPQFILRPSKKPSVVSKIPQIELNYPPFLPTPFKPESQGQSLTPTSPTQSEVSTVFAKLSLKMQTTQTPPTLRPFDVNEFNIKEVSTHYPILGKPVFEMETKNEISSEENATTGEQDEEVGTTTTTTTQRPRRRRPILRQRFTTTTTEEPSIELSVESYESQKMSDEDNGDNYNRQRRPNRYRTTTPEYDDDPIRTRGRHRYRQRPDQQPIRKRVKITTTETPEVITEIISDGLDDYRRTAVTTTETEKKIRYETIAPVEIEVGTTERAPVTNLHVPENEIVENEVTTSSDSDMLTTTVTTTTSSTTTAKPSNRIRNRPIKYDNSNRPRFSVKDYRQKLSQYSSTTTETPRTTSESYRVRYPNRVRRPLATTTTVSSNVVVDNDEETTEAVRSKFVPKNPRFGADDSIISDNKGEKKVNTRLRPFGRHRSTTVATTAAPKVSIRPNLFGNRRRPPMLSLRDRVRNKNKTVTQDEEEKPTTTEMSVNLDVEEDIVDQVDEESVKTDGVETTTVDIMKSDAYMYSQRVSDLTSSFKDEFKSVPPTSRRIPSYFTIATDDPILPIEAFFPNIKDKDKQ